MGVAALLIVGFAGALVVVYHEPSPLVVTFVTVMGWGFASLAVFLAVARLGYLKGLTDRLTRAPKLRVLTESAGLIARARRPLFELVLWSFLFQALAVVGVAAIFTAIGLPVDLSICAVAGAISALVAVLPISINGIGVSEGSFVAVAVSLGVNLEYAVVVALMMRALVVPLSVGCGLVYLWEIRSSGKPSDGTLPIDRPDDSRGDADGKASGGNAPVDD
jgi:uncharacterized membrane protein YbhN (UPF0104 family)